MEANPKEREEQKNSNIGIFVTNIRRNIVYYCLASVFCVLLAFIYILVGYTVIASIILGITIIYTVVLAVLLSRALKSTLNSLDDFASTNKKKEKLITHFSHRIREPLNNMLIISNILKESDLTGKHSAILDNLDTSISNMITAVDELTMQSAGNIILEARKSIRYNLISTIQSAIDLYNQRSESEIKINLEKNDASTDYIGDPVLIKQIFLDIINRIDEHYEGPLLISIKHQIKKLANNRHLIALSIEADKPVLMIDTNDPEESLSPKLISLAKGTFKQEMNTDSTLLSIFIPAKIAEGYKKQIASQKMEELMEKEKTTKELKDIKVLLAEDNVINREITLMTLKPMVKSIDSAGDGKEALELFGTSDYDIVLMDVQMPVMDGLTASMKIRELETNTNTHVPIIAITANAMLGDKEKCLAAGIDEYISKPFHPSYLIEMIRKLI